MDKILFLGDSITDCERFYSRDGLGEGYVKILSSALPYKIINSGFNGFTAADIKRRLKFFLQAEPKYISLLVGVNDVPAVMEGQRGFERFSDSYESILRDLTEYKDKTLIILPFIFSIPAEFIMWKKVLSGMTAEIRRLCRIYGYKNILDAESIFKTEEENRGSSALTTDGIHLTQEGHKVLAENWLKSFKETMINSSEQICR